MPSDVFAYLVSGTSIETILRLAYVALLPNPRPGGSLLVVDRRSRSSGGFNGVGRGGRSGQDLCRSRYRAVRRRRVAAAEGRTSRTDRAEHVSSAQAPPEGPTRTRGVS